MLKKKNAIKKVIKGLGKAVKAHTNQTKMLKGAVNGASKKGTGKKPKGSGRRLYTDENPKDTVKIKFATPALVIPAPFLVGLKFFLFLAGILSCLLII